MEEIVEGMRGGPEGVGGAPAGASGNSLVGKTLGAIGGAVGGGAPPLPANPGNGGKAVEAFPECVAAGLAGMGVQHAKFQENYGKVILDLVLPMQRQLAADVARKISISVATAAAAAADEVSSICCCAWEGSRWMCMVHCYLFK